MHYTMSYPKDKTKDKIAPKPVTRPTKAFPGRKPRSQKPVPFDPEDLTKRLYVVLAEQKAHADKKHRRAKIDTDGHAKRAPPATDSKTVKTATKDRSKGDESHGSTRARKDSAGETLHRTASTGEGEDGSAAAYRHVPQVAASQFTRTTTVETVSEKAVAHKLSMAAMKFHRDGPNASREMTAVTAQTAPNQQTRALRRVQSQRERQYERNQFQHPAILESSPEVDDQQTRRAQRHTFEAHLKTKGLDPDDDMAARRRSTGSNLGTVDASGLLGPVKTHDTCDSYDMSGNPEEHRVDWTQSDEVAGQPLPVVLPILRKPESKWTLRGRLGSFNKHGKDDKGLSPPAEGVIPEDSPLKSPKSGFFARFKR